MFLIKNTMVRCINWI